MRELTKATNKAVALITESERENEELNDDIFFAFLPVTVAY